MSRFHTLREARLKQLRQLGPVVAASLCKRWSKCGNPNCRCARGDTHLSWCLTYKHNGKTHTVHVPREMLKEVRQWVREYKRAKKFLKQISYQSLRIIKAHVPEKRAAARAKEKR